MRQSLLKILGTRYWKQVIRCGLVWGSRFSAARRQSHALMLLMCFLVFL